MNYNSTQVKQLVSGYVADLIRAGFYLSAFEPEHEDGWSSREICLRDTYGGELTLIIDTNSEINYELKRHRRVLGINLNYSVRGFKPYTENLLTLYQVNPDSYRDCYYTEDINHADECYARRWNRFEQGYYQKREFLGGVREINSDPRKLQILARAVARKTGMKNPPSKLKVDHIGRTYKGTPLICVSYSNNRSCRIM